MRVSRTRVVAAYLSAFVLQILGSAILVAGLFAFLVGIGVLDFAAGVEPVVGGVLLMAVGALIGFSLARRASRALAGKDIVYGQTGVFVDGVRWQRQRRRR